MLSLEARRQVTNPDDCVRFQRALVPNIIVLVYVPDQDRDCQPLPQHEYIAHFKVEFSRLCGGHAPTVGGPDGDYDGRAESTVVISSYLPEVVTRSLRDQLLELLLDFGVRANQEVVLVAVGGFAHRLRFAARPSRRPDGGSSWLHT